MSHRLGPWSAHGIWVRCTILSEKWDEMVRDGELIQGMSSEYVVLCSDRWSDCWMWYVSL